MSTTRRQIITNAEKNVGSFSQYATVAGAGENIPFAQKPAQQLLQGLGCTNNVGGALTRTTNGQPLNKTGNPAVVIKSFTASKTGDLTISGGRINRLLNSAKIYINTAILPAQIYTNALANSAIRAQTKEVNPETDTHWQNLAVGICHAQEIDLLMTQNVNSGGAALADVRTGQIQENAPAILLLSSPALNFAYGQARFLEKNAPQFIQGMYRNLFNAAVSENRQYIVMPAAGLGVFGGDPNVYFEALMTIAKEYPNLTIVYHPARFGTEFKTALQRFQPSNVVQATKDVVFLADELCRAGHPCALHNPSDCDVVYGVYDIGEYWKTGKGSGYVAEEHIGAMTTAPLNSRLLNPSAYTNVVEFNPAVQKKRSQQVASQDTKVSTNNNNNNNNNNNSSDNSGSAISTTEEDIRTNAQLVASASAAQINHSGQQASQGDESSSVIAAPTPAPAPAPAPQQQQAAAVVVVAAAAAAAASSSSSSSSSDNGGEPINSVSTRRSHTGLMLTAGVGGGVAGYFGGSAAAASGITLGLTATTFVLFSTVAGAGLLMLMAYLLNRSLMRCRPGLFSSSVSANNVTPDDNNNIAYNRSPR